MFPLEGIKTDGLSGRINQWQVPYRENNNTRDTEYNNRKSNYLANKQQQEQQQK